MKLPPALLVVQMGFETDAIRQQVDPMHRRLPSAWMSGIIVAAFAWCSSPAIHAAETSSTTTNHYRTGAATRDGIGKFYFGREIAKFMTYHGAPWLERTERQEEERSDLLMKALKFQPGEAVADIGAGSGYYSRLIARAVGTNGVVFGTDIQQEMLDILTNKAAQAGIYNIRPVLGTESDPKLAANSVDTILIVDVYHEMEFPFEMMAGLASSLKPGGRLVLVEYRGEDRAVPIKELHKMTEEQVKKELAPHPLKFDETLRMLPWQHVMVFRKNGPTK